MPSQHHELDERDRQKSTLDSKNLGAFRVYMETGSKMQEGELNELKENADFESCRVCGRVGKVSVSDYT